MRPHPAKAVLALRGVKIKALARDIHYHPFYVGRVLNGHESGSERFRYAVADALDLPVGELFRDELEVAQ